MNMKEALKLAALIVANIAFGVVMVAFGADTNWGKLDATTGEVEPYMGEVKTDAEMYADGWKKVTETRDPKPIGSMADYKYVWQATPWTETATTLSRNWVVVFEDGVVQPEAAEVDNTPETNKVVTVDSIVRIATENFVSNTVAASAPGDYASISNLAKTAVQPSAIADMETTTHATATYQAKSNMRQDLTEGSDLFYPSQGAVKQAITTTQSGLMNYIDRNTIAKPTASDSGYLKATNGELSWDGSVPTTYLKNITVANNTVTITPVNNGSESGYVEVNASSLGAPMTNDVVEIAGEMTNALGVALRSEIASQTPGNYATVSNRAMTAVQLVQDSQGEKTAVTIGSRAEGSSVGNASLVVGNGSTASGPHSVAIGNVATSTGGSALAVGSGSIARGDGGVAIGQGETDTGLYSLAANKGYAYGNYNTAVNYGVIGKKDWSQEQKVAVNYGFAFGFSTVMADYAAAGGYYALATDEKSFVWSGGLYEQVETYHYPSHGEGTFNINPVGGAEGFWIGETNLSGIVSGATNGLVSASYVDQQNAATRAIVQTWEQFLDGSNVVFSITNYISGSYVLDEAKLRILEMTNGVYREVYNSRGEIVMHLADFETNVVSVAVADLRDEIAAKADKAWGKYTSAGGDAPSNTVYMTAPNTIFAGGLEYERVAVGEGMVGVLTTHGAPAYTAGDEGTFKFQDDGGTNYFGFAKTDSYTIGCRTDGISVEQSTHIVTLEYDVTMSGVPCVWYAASLVRPVSWEQLNTPDGQPIAGASHVVSWEQNPPAGKEICYINCTEAKGFFKATIEVPGSAKFMTNMPADFSGGILCTDGQHKVKIDYNNGNPRFVVVQ